MQVLQHLLTQGGGNQRPLATKYHTICREEVMPVDVVGLEGLRPGLPVLGASHLQQL